VSPRSLIWFLVGFGDFLCCGGCGAGSVLAVALDLHRAQAGGGNVVRQAAGRAERLRAVATCERVETGCATAAVVGAR